MSSETDTTVCDGNGLLAALDAAGANLEHHAEAINALNVFPVPDGDTGKNMLLTMQAALAAVHAAAAEGTTGAGPLAAKLARGAMMGSRGNSGVILSQILRGFARGIGEEATFDGQLLAVALREAATTAYRAVQHPVEGTMLTVIRVAAETAEAAVTQDAALVAVLDATLAGARDALARTPELLARLREAGVVDAGGQGIVTLLEGAVLAAHGETLTASSGVVAPSGGTAAELGTMSDFMAEHGEDEVGYCTNVMIAQRERQPLDFELIRERLLALGESGVVIGDEELIKVHIHTENPGAVLTEAVQWGELDQIRIDNMSFQVEAVSAGVRGATAIANPLTAASIEDDSGGPQIVAVASGDGLIAVLQGLGAQGIVSGGQTMNPSTEELLRAVEALPGNEVIILPNNSNVILTAEQVVDLTSKQVVVVPTRSVPQGIAALAAVNFDDTLTENAEAMTEAAQGIRSAEITHAVRTTTIGGVDVIEGQAIGLIDGKLVYAADTVEAVLFELLARTDATNAELITLYQGLDVPEAAGAAMVELIHERYGDLAVELVEGGQPHYDYLMSVE